MKYREYMIIKKIVDEIDVTADFDCIIPESVSLISNSAYQNTVFMQ